MRTRVGITKAWDSDYTGCLSCTSHKLMHPFFSFHEHSLNNYTFWAPGTMLNAEASGLSKKILLLFKTHNQKEETDTCNNYKL